VAFDSRDVFLNATENGELDIVQEKLSEGVDPCHTNLEGVTGLHNSSIGGHLDIVKLLTEKGADVNGSHIYFYIFLKKTILFDFLFNSSLLSLFTFISFSLLSFILFENNYDYNSMRF